MAGKERKLVFVPRMELTLDLYQAEHRGCSLCQEEKRRPVDKANSGAAQ